jgi:autotransporter-associated beta strand protein
MWTGGIIADGVNNTANFTGVDITGAKAVGLSGVNRTIGNIVFEDLTTASHDLTISGAGVSLTLDVTSGSPIINVINRNLTISTTVAGNDGLTKSGAGGLILSGSNTYTGGTTLSGGLTTASHNSAFGTGTVSFSGTATGMGLSNGINVANNITIGTNTGLAGQGLIRVADSNTATLSGTITINNAPSTGGHFGGTSAGGTGITNITGAINSSVDVSQRSGTVVLSGGGSYTNFNTNQGTTRLGADNGLATTATVNLGTSGTSALDLRGFNQALVGITRVSTFGGSVVNGVAGTSTLTTTGTSTFSGVIGTGTGTVAITVSGGALTLTGTNTYVGATNITGGTLALTGTGAINGTSGININGSGAKFLHTGSVAGTRPITITQGNLTGSGTVGAVTVADSASAVLSNNNNAVGASLTTGDITFNGAATVNTFNVNTSAAIVAGALATNAAGTVTINPSGTWTTGTHTLISYTGGSVGGAGFGKFALGTVGGLSGRQTTGPLVDSGSALTLDITGDNPVWTGVGSTIWTTATFGDGSGSNAWELKAGATGTNFWANDTVEFNDTFGVTPVTNSTVTITGGVAPTATVFNNSVVNYTVNSSDATGITAGTLTKSGTGTVIFNANNTYAGNTTITGGTLQLGNGGTNGSLSPSSAISVGTGATFTVNQSDTVTQGIDFSSAAITGLGGIAQAGSGTTVLTANNTYTGPTTVSAGILVADRNVGSINALSSSAVDIASGATVEINVLKISNVTDTIGNTFSGSGLLKLDFAANTTAKNTGLSGLTGFNGTVELTSSGVTGDKLTVASLSAANTSIVVNSGQSIASSGITTFAGMTINGAGNNENRGAIRVIGGTLNGNISLASSSRISADPTSGAGTIAGNISGSTAGSKILTLGGTSATNGALSGVISDGAGTVAVTQAVGNFTLSGANTYTGGTIVSAGSLILSGSGTTGATTGSLTVNGGTMNFGGLARILGAVTIGGGTISNGTLTGASYASTGGTVSATLAGEGTYTHTSGTTTLSGANTYTGATTIEAGTLVISGSGSIATSTSVTIKPTATLNTSALASYTIPTGNPLNFSVDGTGSGSSGKITAANLNVAGATVTYDITGPLDDPAYVLATYSGTLTGTFLSVPAAPAGYTLDYAYEGNKIALVQSVVATPYDTWATDKGLTALNNAKNLNPDNDGLNNLGEFAFNGNPLSGSDNGKVFVLNEDSDLDVDALKELILTVAVRSGTSAFSGSPSPTAAQAADGITYAIEGSLDLAGFPATVNVVSPITAGLPPAGTGYEYRSFILSGSNGLLGKGFLRAKVTSP